MHTKWIRGGMLALVLVAALGLVLVACHKKEGAEQSGAVAVPAIAAPAPTPVEVSPAPAPGPVPAQAAAAPQGLDRQGTRQVPPPARATVRQGAGAGENPLPSAGATKKVADRIPPGDPARLRNNPEPQAAPRPVSVGQSESIESSSVDLSRVPAEDVTTFQRPALHKPTGLKAKMDRNRPFVNPVVQLGDQGAPSSLIPVPPDTKAAPAPGQTGFLDHEYQGSTPPDVDMAVGTTHMITDYNTYFRVWDKSTPPVLVGGPTTLRTLFTGLTNCGATETATNALTDPQVVYDDENDRFVLTALRYSQTYDTSNNLTAQSSWLCVACTDNPTGTWNTYQVAMPATILADYPHLGIGEDAVFIGTNDFDLTGYAGSSIWALDKAQLYAGPTLTTTRQTFSADMYTPQPAERRGFASGQYPPSGSPHYFMVANNTTGYGEVWTWPQPTFSSNAAIWGGSVLTYPGGTVNPADPAYTTGAIDAIDYRFFDAELRWPKLYTARVGSTGAPAYDFIQWAEIDVSGATPTVGQNGNYSPAAATHAWMPDVTVDKDYNFAVGFTRASATGPLFVGAYLTGRDAATPANQLEASVVSKTGERIFTGIDVDTTAAVFYRWGDYLGMSPDPNGCDIWFNGEYSRDNALADKAATWVRPFKFASCVPGATRAASLNKGRYFCADTVNATIIDTAGAPTNAVFHSTTGGAVPTTVSGTGPTYVVAPKTIAQLGAVDGDDIWLTFTGDDAVTYSSAHATLDCSLAVCVYVVDPLSGGCDNDSYHDEGETLNYNIGIANYETFPLPGPFTADLVLRTADANVQILAGQATFAALDAETYDYPEVPFAVKYTGAIASQCKVPLQFQVTNIRAVDGGWTSTGCPAGSENFDEIANRNDNPGAALFSEGFEGTTLPALPAGWSQVDISGTALNWATAAGTVHPAGTPPHTGTRLAYANSWTPQPPADCRLFRTSGFSPGSPAMLNLSFWMFHDTQYSNEDYLQIQTSPDGTTWNNRGVPVYRFDGTGIQAWKKHDVDITVDGGLPDLRIAFLGVGAYGNDMHIDDVMVAPITADCEDTVCTSSPSLAYDFWTFEDPACNGDEWLDPNEVGALNVYVANGGNDWAWDVVGTLSCPSCPAGWGVICDDSADYGDIPYGTPYGYGPATDKFQIALNAAVPSGTILPFQITLQGSNYGPVVINTPLTLDDAAVFVGTEYRYEDHFEQASPDSTAAWDRVGFSSPGWVEVPTADVTGNATPSTPSTCTDADGDGVAAKAVRGSEFYRIFSTAGASTSLTLRWEWQLDGIAARESVSCQYTLNGGSSWTTLRSQAGNGGVTPWYCNNVNLATEVPGALNNPAFGVKFVGAGSKVGAILYVDNFRLVGTGTHPTSCTGICPVAAGPPPVPNNGDIAGTAFELVKNGNNVDMTWDAATCTAGGYAAFWGDLATLSMNSGVTNGVITSAVCSLGVTGSASNQTAPSPAAGQCYFVVVTAVEGTEFGRHGNNSNGNERVFTGETVACPGLTAKNITETTCN